ncbi:MAG: transporter [Ferruginibacter sp.]
MIKLFFFISFLSFGALNSFAQLEKIDTDRPDQTESPATVPKKWLQFEMGFLKQANKNPYKGQERFKDMEFQHPTLLTRYGLTRFFELRLETTYATSRGKEDNTIIDRQHGIESVQAGGKVNFFKEKGVRPKTSLIAHYDFGRLRTLNKDTADGASIVLAMQHTASEKISISYNLGMEWGRFGEPPAYLYTFSTGFDLSDKWSGFVEVFGSAWKNENPENSIDAGIAYCANSNIKLDFASGFGVSKFAPDWFIAIGGSIRFKTGK